MENWILAYILQTFALMAKSVFACSSRVSNFSKIFFAIVSP